MNKERERILRRIEALPDPRHLFVLPPWVAPAELDELIRDGYLDCQYQQRGEKGELILAMGLHITAKGARLLRPGIGLPRLFFKGSLAGASFMAMSLLILYLG